MIKLSRELKMGELRDFLDQLTGMAVVKRKDNRVVAEAEEYLSK